MKTWAKVSSNSIRYSHLRSRMIARAAISVFASLMLVLIYSDSDQSFKHFMQLSAPNFAHVDGFPRNVSNYENIMTSELAPKFAQLHGLPRNVSNYKYNGEQLSSEDMGNASPFKPQILSTGDTWMKFPIIPNFTGTLLQRIADNGTQACHDLSATQAKIFGLPMLQNGKPVRLSTGSIHKLVLIAYDANGNRRCAGGDYFETDLSGPGWKSRPPIADLGNGTYSLSLQVHPSFAGLYTLRVVLLFGNFHAFHKRPERWLRDEEMLNIQIEFSAIEGGMEKPSPQKIDNSDRVQISKQAENLLNLKRCGREDFQRLAWTGRWTREKFSSECNVNEEGRFICIDLNEACSNGWCEGPVGALESNGWVYSAHCRFKIFSEEAAWKCLDKKWIFFWGDSNHVDTIRNLLNFVLGFRTIPSVPRRFDKTYERPRNRSQSVRITSLFNGNSNETGNYQGLFSLNDPAFRRQIRHHFLGDSVPDFLIMNSGLHDGAYWRTPYAYALEGVEHAARFWRSVLTGIKSRKPSVMYRTTVTPAARARAFAYNPHKIEAYNLMFLEKLREMQLVSKIVDGFDLTFPWHFDHNCSDGVHYGKLPAAREWYGRMGHQYFVDLMLIHMLLHAICLD